MSKLSAVRSSQPSAADSAPTRRQTAVPLLVVLVVASSAHAAYAQSPPANPAPEFRITDNSFLVEEALNQEPGVFQNIVGIDVGGDGWETSFTQEWPLVSRRHQIAYTVPYAAAPGASGFGNAAIHYRVQILDGAGLAFSPRASLIIPSGQESEDGGGHTGWEVNLPFSRQQGRLYTHLNVGVTHYPSVRAGAHSHPLVTPRVAASGIWQARPMLNLMLEGAVEWGDTIVADRTRRQTAVTILPGIRTGWNAGDTQTIIGVGVPVRFEGETIEPGAFLYLSYELPFSRN